jgi:hypothetical protein
MLLYLENMKKLKFKGYEIVTNRPVKISVFSSAGSTIMELIKDEEPYTVIAKIVIRNGEIYKVEEYEKIRLDIYKRGKLIYSNFPIIA